MYSERPKNPRQIGRGFSVDPTFRMPIPPVQANKKPLPRNGVNNPGEYVEFVTDPFFPDTPLVNRSSIQAPDGGLVVISNQTFNCIEVSMSGVADGDGFVIPDRLVLSCTPIIDDLAGFPFVYEPKPYLFRFGNTDAVALERYQFVSPYNVAMVSPPKVYKAPMLGSYANSTTNYGGNLIRAYGLKDFSLAFLTQWNEYRSGARVVPPNSPVYTIRMWYDYNELVPRVATL